MESIEAILIDIDDCILPVSGKLDLSDNSFTVGLQTLRQIVYEANKTGKPRIGVCSGREKSYCRAMLQAMGCPNAFSIAESGVVLFNPTTEETIWAISPVAKDIFQRVYQEKIKQLCERYSEIVFYEGNEINIALELKKGAEMTISQLAEIVREALRDTSPPLTIHESSIAVDISPAGIDKGSGVRFYSEQTGIPLARILSIGDSKGDFPILELVGFVGCSQNASELCKALIRERDGYVSPFNYAQGVADVISHFTGVRIS